MEHSSASKTANKACLAVQGKVSAGGGDHRPQLISVVKMKMTAWTCSTWNEYSSQPHVVHLRLFRSTMARARLNRMFHVEHCPARFTTLYSIGGTSRNAVEGHYFGFTALMLDAFLVPTRRRRRKE